MGWLPSASASDTSTSNNSNQYGVKTPIVSPQYNDIFNSYAATLGFDPNQWSGTNYGTVAAPYSQASGVAGAPNLSGVQPGSVSGGGTSSTPGTPGYTGPNPQTVTGYNPSQANAVNFMTNNLNNNDINAWTGGVNQNQINTGAALNAQNAGPLAAIQGQNAPQSAGTSQISPTQASQYINSYLSPYLNTAVSATNNLANYNTGVGLNALNASRGAGSAFGDRANLSNGSYLAASNLGTNQTIANMENLGFTNALAPSMADASNNLSAQTSNAANTLSNNQFNANAQLQSTNQKLAAAAQIAQNLQTGAGLSQDILNNIVTANGVNVQAAQNLFNAGTISQAQLNALLDAAGTLNGSQTSQNTNGSTNSTNVKVDTGNII
jgi:hypothetical protein